MCTCSIPLYLQLDDFASFDVFKVARLTQQRPLSTVTMALIQRYDLVAKLSLPVGKLTSFLQVPRTICRQTGPGLCSNPALYWMEESCESSPDSLAWVLLAGCGGSLPQQRVP